MPLDRESKQALWIVHHSKMLPLMSVSGGRTTSDFALMAIKLRRFSRPLVTRHVTDALTPCHPLLCRPRPYCASLRPLRGNGDRCSGKDGWPCDGHAGCGKGLPIKARATTCWGLGFFLCGLALFPSCPRACLRFAN
jgi:hypothetical protein